MGESLALIFVNRERPMNIKTLKPMNLNYEVGNWMDGLARTDLRD